MKFVVVIIAVLVVAGSIWFTRGNVFNPINSTVKNESATTTAENGTIDKIIVDAQDLQFNPDQIHVHVGDRVSIEFTNLDESQDHEIHIAGYDIGSPAMHMGTEHTVDFVADKSGEFEYYCTINGARILGMKGILYVDP